MTRPQNLLCSRLLDLAADALHEQGGLAVTPPLWFDALSEAERKLLEQDFNEWRREVNVAYRHAENTPLLEIQDYEWMQYFSYQLGEKG